MVFLVGLKGFPAGMFLIIDAIKIVHARAFQPAVIEYKSARFNNIDSNAEARGHSENSAAIVRNVGLVKCETHKTFKRPDRKPDYR